jgi:Double-GTPase 2
VFTTEKGVPQQVLHVTMIGPRGVGKTSLLASLYDQFQAVCGEANLVMTADEDTRGVLQHYREQLNEFASGRPGSARRSRGIEGNLAFREHRILLGTGGRREPQIMLCFTDVPGEALSSGTAMTTELRERLDRSAVLFLAIDTPALMERDGRYHQEINKPNLVADFVREVAAKGGDLLVVMVPLKCEKYVHQPDGMRKVRARVHESYYDMIAQLGGLEGGSTGVVLTPVQTVGSMVFKRFNADGVEDFGLYRLGATYAPVDTDQPLRWMLRFVLNGYRKRDKTLMEALRGIFTGDGVRLAEALRVFATGCKLDRDGGFDVLLGHRFLDLP